MKEFLDRVPVSPHIQVEFSRPRQEKRVIGWADGKPSLQNIALEDGLCVRVLDAGKEGTATTRAVSPVHVSELVESAVEMARFSSSDKYRSFTVPGKQYPTPLRNEDRLFQKSIDEILGKLSSIEKMALSLDKRVKKMVRLHFSESMSFFSLAHNHGLSVEAKNSHVAFSLEVLVEEKGESEVGWDYCVRRFEDQLDLEHMARSLVVQTLQSLGGTPIASGPKTVVLHPRVGTQLLSLVGEALSAEAVQRARSFWRGKKNSLVASKYVTLTDDPLLPDGVASVPFDDEGMPHQTTCMVKEGVLQDYFYDLKSASMEGRESNGHAVREGLGGAPHPGPSNFYLSPGATTPEKLLEADQSIFQVTDVMGLHMADPITGEFSLGASGALYENGKYSRAVRGVTIAGSVGTLLEKVAAVGNDLTWIGATGCPSLLVSDLMVAGR